MSNKYGYVYINLYDAFLENEELKDSMTIDGVHLNEDGYETWAKLINEYINN